MNKRSTSLWLSETAKELLRRLSKKLSISQSAVLEIAIRKLAKSEGIKESGSNPEGDS